VITAAQTVRIDGTVGNSVRAGASTVDVAGRVGGDVLAGATKVNVTGVVKRDLAVGAQDVSVTNSVGRNVMTGSNTSRSPGSGRRRQSSVDPRDSGKGGSVVGNLEYWSAEQASVQGNVAGATSRHEPPTKQAPSGAAGIATAVLGSVVAWIESLVGFLLLGLLMVFVLRDPRREFRNCTRPNVAGLGVGALVFFATPMVIWPSSSPGCSSERGGSRSCARGILAGVACWPGRGQFGRWPGDSSQSLGHRGTASVWSLLLGLVLVWLVGAIPFVGRSPDWWSC